MSNASLRAGRQRLAAAGGRKLKVVVDVLYTPAGGHVVKRKKGPKVLHRDS